MSKQVDMVGCAIKSIHRGDDYLYFTTDKGVFKFVVDADCCSHTWINDLTGVSNVLGKQVTAVEDVEDGSPLDNTMEGGEYIQFYAKELRTTGGVLTVCYRNSSNGYYGGSLDGPYMAECVPEGFQAITEDWSM
jgi:hypothetical protein